MAIFSLVSIAVYSTFSSGMSVWRLAMNTGSSNILLKTEKLSRELRQSFYFKDSVFSGTKDSLSFPSRINQEAFRLAYFFDPVKNTLLRSSDSLTDVINAAKKNEEVAQNPAVYLSEVKKLSFSYFYFDSIKGSYLWKDDWDSNFLPLAVKIEISGKDSYYAKTVFIPSA